MVVTNTFSPNTKIKSSEINQNFTDLAGKIVYFQLTGDTGFSSTNINYGNESNIGKAYFYFISNLTNISAVYFYCNLYKTAGAEIAYARIYNNTTASLVTGSEVSTTNTSNLTWVMSGNISANLSSSENQYNLQCHSGGTDQAIVAKAYLKIVFK